MLGKMIAGGSAADGAPQYSGNFGAPANYWQGNQFMMPGAPQQPQTQPPQAGGLLGLLQQGGLGVLPMLLSGGKMEDFRGPGLGGMLRGQLFK